jgi:hypothetical protein
VGCADRARVFNCFGAQEKRKAGEYIAVAGDACSATHYPTLPKVQQIMKAGI